MQLLLDAAAIEHSVQWPDGGCLVFGRFQYMQVEYSFDQAKG
jgi:hypothetical protein